MSDEIDDVLPPVAPTKSTVAVGAYSWNVFRYIGDYMHACAVLLVIATLGINKHCRGLSFKTQLFYLVIFLSRYLDIFSSFGASNHGIYLLVFKLFYIFSAAAIVIVMRSWRATIETNKDTCSIAFVVIPCILVSMLTSVFSSNQSNYSFTRFMWTFSELLEAFAMVPQYIFTYRQEEENKRSDKKIFLYIILIGGYRCLYAMNWIYKKTMLGSAYSDFVSWIGGLIEILLFIDFVVNKSFLKFIVLGIDSKINVISKQIEMKVLPHNNTAAEDEIDAEIFSNGTGMRKRKGPAAAALDEEDEAMLMI